MSGRVWLGVGIAALFGAGIFGAGFWLARRVLPAAVGREAGLRILVPGGFDGRDGLMGRMPFHVGPEGGLMHFGPGVEMGPHGPGRRISTGPHGHMGQGFPESPAEPLTASEARQAVEAFLASMDQTGLQVGEVIVFEDHAYAVVEEAETGTGAFEVLVDAGSRAVHLEFGPAMMWNTEFGMGTMAGHMGQAGQMPGFTQPDPSVEPAVTADRATQIAQAYLGEHHPGTSAGGVHSFPGYHTVHYDKNGAYAGMLSVNAYTGQVWEHIWHGELFEASE